MSLNAQLTLLRSLLHDSETPRQTLWTHICATFLRWPDDIPTQEAVDYTAHTLLHDPQPWSPHIHWAPRLWQAHRHHSPPHYGSKILEATSLRTPPSIFIPPGPCTLGEPTAPQPWCHDEIQHTAYISSGYLIQTTQVTQRAWEQHMGYNPSATQDPTHPVHNISWFEAVLFANALSKAHNLTPFYTVRKMRGHPSSKTFACRVRFPKIPIGPGAPNGWYLPSETQWEHAARALASAMIYAPRPLCAWYADNSERTTHPVAEKLPSLWGIHDVLGNVWEWCSDAYVPYALHPHQDPFISYPDSLQRETRSLRGGSYLTEANNLRLSNRWHLPPTWRRPDIGLRLVRNFNLPSNAGGAL